MRKFIQRGIVVLVGLMMALPLSGASAAFYSFRPTVCFGDSITWGWNASVDTLPPYNGDILPISAHLSPRTDTTYPSDLENMLGIATYNYGYSGENTVTGTTRLQSLMTQVHPGYVFLMEGVNDLFENYSVQDVANRISNMVTIVQQYGGHPVLLTLTPVYLPSTDPRYYVDNEVQQLDSMLRTMATQRHIQLIDVDQAFLNDPLGANLTMQSNGVLNYIHPNDTGYKLIASTIASHLITPSFGG